MSDLYFLLMYIVCVFVVAQIIEYLVKLIHNFWFRVRYMENIKKQIINNISKPIAIIGIGPDMYCSYEHASGIKEHVRIPLVSLSFYRPLIYTAIMIDFKEESK